MLSSGCYPGGEIVDSLELREEIRHGGATYFLQTSFILENRQIQSSFFRNGTVFDTVIQDFDEIPPKDQLRELTKGIHNRNKKKFRFLLDARDRISKNKDPHPHIKLAQALSRRNLHTEAIAEAQAAIEKGLKDSSPFIVIGEAWFRIGDFDSAFEATRKCLELSPDYPDLHNLMGSIYLEKKMCRQAAESFRRAISLNLYFGEPYVNLVRAYLLNSILKQDYELSRGLEEKFDSNLKRAVQLNPFIDSRKIEEAREMVRSEKFEEALVILGSISESYTRISTEEIILELYLTLLQSGEDLPEKEIEDYLLKISEIIDRNPTFADAYNSIGILYTAKCKILMDKAGKAFEKALEINPGYAKARKNQRLTENDRQGLFILLKALLD